MPLIMTDNGGGGGGELGGAVGTVEVPLPLQAANTETAASTDVLRMILDDLLRFCFRDVAMFILYMEIPRAQWHTPFLPGGLLEALVKYLLQRGDNAVEDPSRTAKTIQGKHICSGQNWWDCHHVSGNRLQVRLSRRLDGRH
jgi:hypothetical protein